MSDNKFQRLSVGEMEVLKLLAGGWSNLYITKQLFISKDTLTNKLVKIYNKLELTGTREKARNPRVTAALMYYIRPLGIFKEFPDSFVLEQWEYEE